MNTTELFRPRKRVNLAKRYEEEIQSWNWPDIKTQCTENLYIEDGDLCGDAFLGSVLSIYPSGKYYTPWCSNQTWADVVKDSLFGEVIESIAEEHGLSVTI